MNLSSKSRYAMKIMMDLVFHEHEGPIHGKDIARRQGVPEDYLEQILLKLRKAQLVTTVRGRSGGYRLARSAETIPVFDLFQAVEENLYPVECVAPEQLCEFEVSCVAYDPWHQIFSSLKRALKDMTLSSLVGQNAARHHMCPIGGTKECRLGKASGSSQAKVIRSNSSQTRQRFQQKNSKDREQDV